MELQVDKDRFTPLFVDYLSKNTSLTRGRFLLSRRNLADTLALEDADIESEADNENDVVANLKGKDQYSLYDWERLARDNGSHNLYYRTINAMLEPELEKRINTAQDALRALSDVELEMEEAIRAIKYSDLTREHEESQMNKSKKILSNPYYAFFYFTLLAILYLILIVFRAS